MPKPRSTPARPTFTPVATRARHDGWTPERQVRFVEALAESGCVTEACAAVGMSKQSAYGLRMRTDAQGFRVAWDAALDLAIRRLSDECYSRALHGEAIPHFYQGEQVGEHRRYDNRLAMFLLRYRDPLRYAATLDQMVYAGHPETAALAFTRARDRVRDEAHGIAATAEADGSPPYDAATLPVERARQRAGAQQAFREAIQADHEAKVYAELAEIEAWIARGPSPDETPEQQQFTREMQEGFLKGAQEQVRRPGEGGGGRSASTPPPCATGGGRSPGDVPSSWSTSAGAGTPPAPATGSAGAILSGAFRRQQPRIRGV